MRSTITSGILVIFTISSILAQTKDTPKFQLTDLSITTGIETYFNQSVTDDFLLGKVSGSSLIPQNFEEYNNEGYSYSNGTGSFEIMAGFAWGSSEEYGMKVHKRLQTGTGLFAAYFDEFFLLPDGFNAL